jgi:hypothetical protein
VAALWGQRQNYYARRFEKTKGDSLGHFVLSAPFAVMRGSLSAGHSTRSAGRSRRGGLRPMQQADDRKRRFRAAAFSIACVLPEADRNLLASGSGSYRHPHVRSHTHLDLPHTFAAGGLSAVLMTFCIGERLFGGTVGLLGTSLLASSAVLVTEATRATTDAVLLACTVCAEGSLGDALFVAGAARTGSCPLRSRALDIPGLGSFDKEPGDSWSRRIDGTRAGSLGSR